MSYAKKFIADLGAKISGELGVDHKYFRSRREFRFASERGHNSVILTAATKYSPEISIHFIFGCFFVSAGRAEVVMDGKAAYYQILNNSINVRGSAWKFKAPTTWSVNILEPPPSLVSEIAEAIVGVALPFFSRFPDEWSALDAVQLGDPQVLTRRSQSLSLSAAVGKLVEFEEWADQGNASKWHVEKIKKLRQAGYN